VEMDIADQLARAGKTDGEKVYVKATGRAIPRALELGVVFQGEKEWTVRVEMGCVRAIDDIDVQIEAGEECADEVPETRIRNVSSITVSIGVK
jgi:ribonuclease P/MRP protein subunit POP7